MTSNLAKNLRVYAEEYKYLSNHKKDKNIPDILIVAADTIEELSAKVSRQNMDRSSQYYGGGWISVEERLPKDGEEVLVWYEYFRYGDYNCMFQTYGIGYQFDGHWSGDVNGTKARCIAWQPLPPAYEPKEKKLTEYDSPFCNEIEK